MEQKFIVYILEFVQLIGEIMVNIRFVNNRLS